MIPSKYQSAVFDAFDNTNDNLCIEAGPGAGKTTLLTQLSKRVPRYKKAIFLAFNKSIVTELDQKLPDYFDCKTLHSYGNSILYKHLRKRLKVDQYKIFKLSDKIVRPFNLEKKKMIQYKFAIQNIIDFHRITQKDPVSVVKEYDIVCKNGELQSALKVWDIVLNYNRNHGENFMIDFVDMLHIPFELNVTFDQYDIVFIDELQDLNALQHKLIEKILKPNGRIIGVGDDHQSVYGFSGASTNSISDFKAKFKTTNLPLSISYRLPKTGVTNVHYINKALEYNNNAIEGIIRDGTINEIQEQDFVICRNTRPLVDLYFQLLQQEKKATIMGRDIEKGLLRVVESLEIDTLSKKEAIFALQQEKHYIYEILKNEGVSNPFVHFKYLSFSEKADIIELFLNKYETTSLVKQKLHEVFDENREGVKLMTGHRSKGLENDTVFFVTHYDNKKLIPSPWATTAEQLKQEKNLEYVIKTRHKKELVYIKL